MAPIPRRIVSVILSVFMCLAVFLQVETSSAQSERAELAGTAVDIDLKVEALNNLTSEERRDLLARLSDEQVRQIFLAQLERFAADSSKKSASQAAGFMSNFGATLNVLYDRFLWMISAVDQIQTVPRFLVERLTMGKDVAHLLVIVFGFAAMVLAGLIAEWLLRWIVRGFLEQIQGAAPASFGQKLVYLAMQMAMDLLSLALFCAVALGLFFGLYQGHEPTRVFVLTYLWAIVLVRIVSLVSRYFLAPSTPSLRIPPLSDANARYMHTWILWLAVVAAFTFLTGDLLKLLGLDERLYMLFRSALGALFVTMLIFVVWRHRQPIANLIRSRTPASESSTSSHVGQVLAGVWHIFAIVLVVAIWVHAEIEILLWTSSPAGSSFGILLLALALPLADWSIRRAVANYFGSGGDETSTADKGTEAPPIISALVILRAARILLALFGITILARLLGIDIFALSSARFGVDAMHAILEIGITLLLAYLAWEFSKRAIERRLAEENGGELSEQGGGSGAGSRLKTLLPLFRRFLLVTIFAMAVMITLSTMGVNIGPLLAGAGVVGIAIGFGAQTLVRDIVSGVFFLSDDAFRVGEYVDVGGSKGAVEGITVRSLILRHHMGPLNFVPFGEIRQLTNFSRDFNIVKLQFRVTYDTDMNKVKRIVQQISEELMADEELRPSFIDPLKSQGVYAMEDSAMIIRVKFTTKPGEQFTIRKMVFQRIQKAFKENGINFAHREVTVHVPGITDLENREAGSDAPEAAAGSAASKAKVVEDAAAAALSIIAQEEEENKGKRES